MKKTPPNKPKPDVCEVPGCDLPPVTVLGGYWFCRPHGNRDYEQRPARKIENGHKKHKKARK